MLLTLLSALITGAASLILGQGVLRLCGWRDWSWLAGPVGFSVLMLLASPAMHVPGRAVTCGIAIAVVVVAATVALVRDRARTLRPPVLGLAWGLWPLALALVPFAVAGRTGILGVSILNDMHNHLLWVEGIMSQQVIDVGPFSDRYPLGPHSVAAAISATTGMDADLAFAGIIITLPVLLGWTALEAVRTSAWWRQLAVVALCGMPFLIAAYYGQAGFKEILMAAYVLAFVLVLERRSAAPASSAMAVGRERWIPAALLVAGMISTYSYTGVIWPLVVLVLWLGGLAVATLLRRRRDADASRRAWRTARSEVVPMALALVLLVVVLVPQLARIQRYLGGAQGTSVIDKSDVGNLVSRISPWEALGMWDNPDFRFPPVDALTVGAWSGLVLALCLVGAVAWVRRGRWLVPAAALGAWLIWVYTDATQGIYVGPKALAVLSPLLLLTAAGAFLGSPWARPGSRALALVAPIVACVLVAKVTEVSLDTLRRAPVGPRDHAGELRALRPHLSGQTLFLGVDDFLDWELAGKRAQAVAFNPPSLPTRPEKAWSPGRAVDIDTIPPELLNDFAFVITPRDPAGSALPPQLERVRSTRTYDLYRRTGTIAPRGILAEGEGPAAVLDCRRDPAARRLSRRSGTAVVEDGGVAVPVPVLYAGADRRIPLRLPQAGTWDLVMAYTSGLPIKASAPGMRETELPPNLDRPGPRYPVGTIRVDRAQEVEVRLQVDGHPLSSTAAPAIPTAFIAVPRATERSVPLRRACGLAVDHYTVDR